MNNSNGTQLHLHFLNATATPYDVNGNTGTSYKLIALSPSNDNLLIRITESIYQRVYNLEKFANLSTELGFLEERPGVYKLQAVTLEIENEQKDLETVTKSQKPSVEKSESTGPIVGK